MEFRFLSRKFRYSYSNVTFKLIIINVAMFFLINLVPSLYGIFAMVPGYIIYYKWVWQVFTYMFVHADFSHILFNMFGLFMFGLPIERRLGSKEFLLFYLLSGTLSGVFSLIAYLATGTNVVLVGASGAIYAVLLAYSVLYPTSVIFLFGILPIRAPYLVIGYALIELFNQVFGRVGGVAHLTHLAGLAIAYLYFVVRLKISPYKEWKRHL